MEKLQCSGSVITNSSKIRSASWAGMPMPVSSTSKLAQPSNSFRVTRKVTLFSFCRMASPPAVCLSAFCYRS